MTARLGRALPLSRRGVLAGAAALVIGLRLPLPSAAKGASSGTNNGEHALNAFVRIAEDDTVTVISKHVEFGQGTYTGLATLLAEELDADWSQIRVEAAPSDPKVYANLHWVVAQGTGGSNALANSFEQMRKAGATARAMLVEAAARRWSAPADEITVERGSVRHASSGHTLRFGALVADAAAMSPPEDVTLKKPADFNLIGRGVPRPDTPGKLDGSAIYGIDVKRPGMLTALLARPPLFGARAAGFDASAALALSGVTDVVETPRGIAVVGRDFWSAKKGRDALAVDWDLNGAEQRSDEEIAADYLALAQTPGTSVHRDEDAGNAIASAPRRAEAAYVLPFLAHAPMEPLNCVIELSGDGCEVWMGSQIQTIDHTVVAQILGLPFEKVRLHTLLAGGSFGRRGTGDGDIASETAYVVKAIAGRAPVRVMWTREDDIRGGRYRGLFVHRVSGGIDAGGRIAGWHQRVVGPSLAAGTFLEDFVVHNGIDRTSVEGVADLPYAPGRLAVELHTPPLKIPTLWWRSGGNSHTAFAVESFVDELAHAAGADPLAFRLDHLGAHPRHLGVLRLAAAQAGWDSPPPPGRARGIALHQTFGTVVAQVAEISRHAAGGPRVERVTCAVDCGLAVNPDVIRAQMEGGIGYGLGALLHNEVRLDAGRVRQSNFHDYPPFRIEEMPQVDVHIVASDAAPTGVGEPGTAPIAPAVANAWFALTGERVRRLPFNREGAGI